MEKRNSYSLHPVEVAGGIRPYRKESMKVRRKVPGERWMIWDRERERYVPGLFASKEVAEEKLRKLRNQEN